MTLKLVAMTFLTSNGPPVLLAGVSYQKASDLCYGQCFRTDRGGEYKIPPEAQLDSVYRRPACRGGFREEEASRKGRGDLGLL